MSIDWSTTSVRITMTGRSGWPGGHSFGWRNTVPGHDIWYVIGGRGTLRGRAGDVTLTTGACLWLTAGHEYEATQDPTNPVRNYYVHFDLLDDLGQIIPPNAPQPCEAIAPRDGLMIDAVIRRVVELIPFYTLGDAHRFRGPDVHIAEALMRGLAMELDESARTVSSRSGNSSQRYHSELVMRVIAKMQDATNVPYTVSGLAEEVGYSPEHFSRIFRSIIGRSPEEFLLNLRIERAKQLLATSDLSIEAVASSLGYGQASYFSTQFRKRVGISPTAYRQANNRQEPITITLAPLMMAV
jgi:AraC-like DNA-binding protein